MVRIGFPISIAYCTSAFVTQWRSLRNAGSQQDQHGSRLKDALLHLLLFHVSTLSRLLLAQPYLEAILRKTFELSMARCLYLSCFDTKKWDLPSGGSGS